MSTVFNNSSLPIVSLPIALSIDTNVKNSTSIIIERLKMIADEEASQSVNLVKGSDDFYSMHQRGGPDLLKKDRYLEDTRKRKSYKSSNNGIISNVVAGVFAVLGLIFLGYQLYRWGQDKSEITQINELLTGIQRDRVAWTSAYQLHYPDNYRNLMEQAFSSAETLLNHKKPQTKRNITLRISLLFTAIIGTAGVIIKHRSVKWIGFGLCGITTVAIFANYAVNSYNKWRYSLMLQGQLKKISEINIK